MSIIKKLMFLKKKPLKPNIIRQIRTFQKFKKLSSKTLMFDINSDAIQRLKMSSI